MLKKSFGLFLCSALLSAPAMAENIVGDVAVLRALDKVTAVTKDFNVKVGESLNFGTLEIAVKHCEKKPPEETPETYVFLQVSDRSVQSEPVSAQEDDKGMLFSGWMFGSNPALSSLEHAVYDVWVLACNEPTGLRGR